MRTIVGGLFLFCFFFKHIKIAAPNTTRQQPQQQIMTTPITTPTTVLSSMVTIYIYIYIILYNNYIQTKNLLSYICTQLTKLAVCFIVGYIHTRNAIMCYTQGDDAYYDIEALNHTNLLTTCHVDVLGMFAVVLLNRWTLSTLCETYFLTRVRATNIIKPNRLGDIPLRQITSNCN